MTCIVGVETSEGVMVGADSCASTDGEQFTMRIKKIFRKPGGYILGVAGSSRVSDILQHHVDLPLAPERGLVRFVVRHVVPAMRVGLVEHGQMLDNGREPDGPAGGEAQDASILLSCGGHLFVVHCDFSVQVCDEGYAAIGFGSSVALGSLYSTRGADARTRVRRALCAAAHHVPGIGAPWTILRS